MSGLHVCRAGTMPCSCDMPQREKTCPRDSTRPGVDQATGSKAVLKPINAGMAAIAFGASLAVSGLAVHGAFGATIPPPPAPSAERAVPLGSFDTLFPPARPALQAPEQAGSPLGAGGPLAPAVTPLPQAQSAPALDQASPSKAPAVLAGAIAPSPMMPSVPPPLPPVRMEKTVILRLMGSDATSGQLMRRLAAGYLASIGDADVSLASGRDGQAEEVFGLQDGRREAISIKFQQPGGAFAELLHGTTDAVLATRRILPAEAELLSSFADMTSPASEAVVGVQGVAAIVGRASSMSSLTLAQLRSILDGRLTDWSQVEGPSETINVYVVDDKEGTREVPQDIVLQPDQVSARVIRVADEQRLADAVAADKSGIGLATFGSTGAAKVLAISVDGADAVKPSESSISTEAYPLSRPIYLYSNPASSNPFPKRFASYMASPGGQSVVDVAGLVPFAIRAEPAVVPSTAPAQFKQLVAGAARLSVTFRFQPDSVALDGRAVHDVALLAAHLKSQRIDPGRVVLAGFADNAGDAAAGKAVSQRRMGSVVAALAKAGVMLSRTATFGGDLPVADNATADGRERNRRVEVYLAPQPGKLPAVASRTPP